MDINKSFKPTFISTVVAVFLTALLFQLKEMVPWVKTIGGQGQQVVIKALIASFLALIGPESAISIFKRTITKKSKVEGIEEKIESLRIKKQVGEVDEKN